MAFLSRKSNMVIFMTNISVTNTPGYKIVNDVFLSLHEGNVVVELPHVYD